MQPIPMTVPKSEHPDLVALIADFTRMDDREQVMTIDMARWLLGEFESLRLTENT